MKIEGCASAEVKIVGGATEVEFEGGNRLYLNHGDTFRVEIDFDNARYDQEHKELEELRGELRRLCPEDHNGSPR